MREIVDQGQARLSMFRLRSVVIASAGCLAAGGIIGAKLVEYELNCRKKQLSEFVLFDNFPLLPIVEASTVPGPPALKQQPIITQSRVGEIMKYGFPSLVNVRNYSDFVVSFDRRTRNAHWVFEHLSPDRLYRKKEEVVDRSKCDFTEDSSIHSYFRATNEDYKKSGYDRGHLAAAGNYRHSQASMQETFFLSNIAPQVGKGFNRDAWNNLEKFVRAIARSSRNVYVCTGPLYLPQRETDGKTYVKYEVIGKNHVAVPTHFFKVVVVETLTGDFEQLSFVMPNKELPPDVPLKNYLVPRETIERAAGLLFFDNLPKNKLKFINKVK